MTPRVPQVSASRGNRPSFQQHAGFRGRFAGQVEVRVALDDLIGDVVILAAFVAQDAQHVAGGEQAHGAAGDVLFGDQALFIGL